MRASKLLLQIDDLLEQCTALKVSELLAKLYSLSMQINEFELQKWCALEVSGYYDTNPALSNDVKVPDYRKVPGYYKDKLGRQIIIEDPDMFKLVNNYHLRQSAAELETIAETDSMAHFRNPYVTNILKQSIGLIADEFHFKNYSVKPIIQEIRNKSITALVELRKKITEDAITEGINPDTPKELIYLHPIVQQTAGELFRNGHYRQAILDTYIALVDAVKVKSSRYDLDNTPLMQSVFSPKKPTLMISKENDEQMGFMWLFSGAIMAIRNPKAHRLIQQKDPQRALEWLSFASVLLRVLDEADVIKPD